MNRFLIITFIAFLVPATTYAQCANPHARMGVLIFNKAHKIMQYCNGDDWIGLRGGRGNGLPSCADGEITQFSDDKWACNDGSGIDNINASNLKSGTVPPTRLGTGSANNMTFLRGDGAWATEIDPKVGTLTNNRWCRSNGSQVICDQDAPSSNNCASGVSLAGACWYIGMAGESCTAVCALLGGYHAATNTYAGHSGNWDSCLKVARASGLTAISSYGNVNISSVPIGCVIQSSMLMRYYGATTTAAAVHASSSRLCACNN